MQIVVNISFFLRDGKALHICCSFYLESKGQNYYLVAHVPAHWTRWPSKVPSNPYYSIILNITPLQTLYTWALHDICFFSMVSKGNELEHHLLPALGGVFMAT